MALQRSSISLLREAAQTHHLYRGLLPGLGRSTVPCLVGCFASGMWIDIESEHVITLQNETCFGRNSTRAAKLYNLYIYIYMCVIYTQYNIFIYIYIHKCDISQYIFICDIYIFINIHTQYNVYIYMHICDISQYYTYVIYIYIYIYLCVRVCMHNYTHVFSLSGDSVW